MGKAICRPVQLTCSLCGTSFTTVDKAKRDYWKETGKAYCCHEHALAAAMEVWKATNKRIAQANRDKTADRMKRDNPMARACVREKVRRQLRAKKWKPVTQGGNGRPLPQPQCRLARALGWPMEYRVQTGEKGPTHPTVYKVDVANPDLRIAIEVDGKSHNTMGRHAQDSKKEEFLSGRGWTVLRFSNRQVMTDLSGCLERIGSTISKLRDTTPTPPTEL